MYQASHLLVGRDLSDLKTKATQLVSDHDIRKEGFLSDSIRDEGGKHFREVHTVFKCRNHAWYKMKWEWERKSFRVRQCFCGGDNLSNSYRRIEEKTCWATQLNEHNLL